MTKANFSMHYGARGRRRGTGQGHPARPMSTILLDASVILAAFDPDDRCHEAAVALLVDGSITLATRSAPETVGPLLSALGRIEDDGASSSPPAP
jgi:hypothetical protein